MTRESRLTMEAFRHGATPPAPATLARYGLTSLEWLELFAAQGWKCPICLKPAAEIKTNTDHEHVRGFDKMKPAEKKQYTRGILCAFCNYRRVHSSISAEIAQRIADYIAAYEARRARAK
jgi:Recombination endonuclease VII